MEARVWLVDLACRKAKEFGYAHEVGTTRPLAEQAREHGPLAGHACLSDLVQGTLCKILDAEEVRPRRVRYYLEGRDPDFAPKMVEVLCVCREVKLLKKKPPSDAVAIASCDEKPALGTRPRTCRPSPACIGPSPAPASVTSL